MHNLLENFIQITLLNVIKRKTNNYTERLLSLSWGFQSQIGSKRLYE